MRFFGIEHEFEVYSGNFGKIIKKETKNNPKKAKTTHQNKVDLFILKSGN